MASTIFRVQSHKFSQDNIQTTLVCSRCDEVFSKEFPLDLEGQTIEFKCPVCGAPGEADLPYKSAEEREEFEEDFEDVDEEEGGEDFDEEYSFTLSMQNPLLLAISSFGHRQKPFLIQQIKLIK